MKGVSIHHRFSLMKLDSKSPLSICATAVLAASIALTFAGCSKAPEAEAPAAAAPAEVAPASAGVAMKAALTPEQVGAQYAIAANPALIQNGELVRTVVKVTNTGTVAINSGGQMPVNLAISLIDKNGEVVAQDFVRASLPAEGIEPGATADVVTEVPAADLAGKGLRFGLVQEAVAWYSTMNVAPLDYGPLSSCDDQGKKTLCGADGKPLSTAQ